MQDLHHSDIITYALTRLAGQYAREKQEILRELRCYRASESSGSPALGAKELPSDPAPAGRDNGSESLARVTTPAAGTSVPMRFPMPSSQARSLDSAGEENLKTPAILRGSNPAAPRNLPGSPSPSPDRVFGPSTHSTELFPWIFTGLFGIPTYIDPGLNR